jgi:cell division cycle 2-like
MGRYVGDPAPKLTALVVTLWYRSPELLLGAKTYDAAVDMWSVGCIFGELLERAAMFQGRNEVDQITKIFAALGIPTAESWPEFRSLPNAKALKLPHTENRAKDMIRPRFPDLTSAGCTLLRDLLSLDPRRRPSAEDMLHHVYFEERPRPKAESLFPTFPSKANQERRPRKEPHAPARGGKAAELDEVDCTHLFGARDSEAKGAGFRLHM